MNHKANTTWVAPGKGATVEELAAALVYRSVLGDSYKTGPALQICYLLGRGGGGYRTNLYLRPPVEGNGLGNLLSELDLNRVAVCE